MRLILIGILTGVFFTNCSSTITTKMYSTKQEHHSNKLRINLALKKFQKMISFDYSQTDKELIESVQRFEGLFYKNSVISNPLSANNELINIDDFSDYVYDFFSSKDPKLLIAENENDFIDKLFNINIQDLEPKEEPHHEADDYFYYTLKLTIRTETQWDKLANQFVLGGINEFDIQYLVSTSLNICKIVSLKIKSSDE